MEGRNDGKRCCWLAAAAAAAAAAAGRDRLTKSDVDEKHPN